MASFNIHLAVAKRYSEKQNKIKDIEEFYRGIIEPDLVENKEKSHYSGSRNKQDILEYLENKILLYDFLKSENMDTDYKKGVFLHLITDYLFFNNFFDKEYLKSTPYEEFCKDLYYSYRKTDSYLEEKYKLEYQNFIEKINDNIRRGREEKKAFDVDRENILLFSKLDNFIEYVSNIDLEKYKDKIIKNEKNILPD